MISDVLLVLGAGFAAAALRTCRHPVLFRIGTFAMVGTSFLAGWLIAGSLAVGGAFAATWFLLPWVEILTRARTLRVPFDRTLEPVNPPAASEFPELHELTQECEELGFSEADDVAWSHGETRHFFRLLTNSDLRTHAAICLVEQSGLFFPYVMLVSRTRDGRVLMTWNYAFSYGLRLPPNLVVSRVPAGTSISEMVRSHSGLQGVVTVDDLLPALPDKARQDMQDDLREQLEHNLSCGLLLRDGPDLIRYSGRGMFFLWLQFLRDFVRFP